MGTVAPAGGGRRVCHGAPATSAPVDHASRASWGRTVRLPWHGGHGRRTGRRGARSRATWASGQAGHPERRCLSPRPWRANVRGWRRRLWNGWSSQASTRPRRRGESEPRRPAGGGLGTDSASRPSSRQPARKSCPPAPPVAAMRSAACRRSRSPTAGAVRESATTTLSWVVELDEGSRRGRETAWQCPGPWPSAWRFQTAVILLGPVTAGVHIRPSPRLFRRWPMRCARPWTGSPVLFLGLLRVRPSPFGRRPSRPACRAR